MIDLLLGPGLLGLVLSAIGAVAAIPAPTTIIAAIETRLIRTGLFRTRLFLTRLFGAWLFGTWLFGTWLFETGLLLTGLLGLGISACLHPCLTVAATIGTAIHVLRKRDARHEGGCGQQGRDKGNAHSRFLERTPAQRVGRSIGVLCAIGDEPLLNCAVSDQKGLVTCACLARV
ncbi:hypothetical protein [Sphingomonas sp. GB1N7]|uniref:hypothetical protein n=1 Tax=Parasphingomonas caseinilytica TaxID=3096158 RepID=UPI002FCC1F44